MDICILIPFAKSKAWCLARSNILGFEFDYNDTCDKATPSMASNNGEGMALRGESETHCT